MKYMRQLSVFAVVLGFMFLGSSQPVTGQSQVKQVASPNPSKSLYQRLGGYDALAAVTDDFLGRLIHDPQLKKFFGGVSAHSSQRIRQLVVDQLCAATGGPCYYIGRDMVTAHKGLGISESDWNVAVNHLVATLDNFKVPEREKSEVLSALGPLKNDIVEK